MQDNAWGDTTEHKRNNPFAFFCKEKLADKIALSQC